MVAGMSIAEASKTDEAAVIEKIDELLATHDPKTTSDTEFLGAPLTAQPLLDDLALAAG